MSECSVRGASVERSVSECGVRVWCVQIFDRARGVSECHEHGSSVSTGLDLEPHGTSLRAVCAVFSV